MELDIRHQNVTLDPELKDHIERRVGFALSRFESRVKAVTVRMKDTNGPRGGVDKVCKIEITMKPGGKLLVEESDGDVHAAVALAAEKLGRAIRREVDRFKTERKKDRTSASGLSGNPRRAKAKRTVED